MPGILHTYNTANEIAALNCATAQIVVDDTSGTGGGAHLSDWQCLCSEELRVTILRNHIAIEEVIVMKFRIIIQLLVETKYAIVHPSGDLIKGLVLAAEAGCLDASFFLKAECKRLCGGCFEIQRLLRFFEQRQEIARG